MDQFHYGAVQLLRAGLGPPHSAHHTHLRNLCKKHDTHIQWKDPKIHRWQTAELFYRGKTSVDVNKSGGVDQNKRGHLAEESEACWVIKEGVDEGALCG